jgi:hypothetical protein
MESRRISEKRLSSQAGVQNGDHLPVTDFLCQNYATNDQNMIASVLQIAGTLLILLNTRFILQGKKNANF